MIKINNWLKVAAIALFTAPLTITAGTPRWRGDANNDGKLTAADLAEMARILVAFKDKPQVALNGNTALDVNKDNKFDKKDLDTLALVLLGKEKSVDMNNEDTGGGFSDSEQGAPGGGTFNDSEQGSPETGGSSGSFSDDQQENPK